MQLWGIRYHLVILVGWLVVCLVSWLVGCWLGRWLVVGWVGGCVKGMGVIKYD